MRFVALAASLLALGAGTALLAASSVKQVPSGSFGVAYNLGVIQELPLQPGWYMRLPWVQVVTAENADNLDTVQICAPNCSTLDGHSVSTREVRYWNHVNMGDVPALTRAWLALRDSTPHPAAGEGRAMRFGGSASQWRYERTVYEKAVQQAYACVLANNYRWVIETSPKEVASLAKEVAHARIRFNTVFVIDGMELEHFTWPGVSYNSLSRAANWVGNGPALGKVNQECILPRSWAPERQWWEAVSVRLGGAPSASPAAALQAGHP